MKKTICLLALNCVFTIQAQQINKAGHFIRNTESLPVTAEHTGNDITFNGKHFQGNTLFKTANGYLSLDGNYENAPASIFIYDNDARLLRSNKYSATINFKLSPAKNFAVFFDKKQLHTVNLTSYKENAFNGSLQFDIDNEGNTAFFDEQASVITYKTFSQKIIGRVSQILMTNKGPLYATDHAVYLIEDGQSREVFNANNHRVFDLYADNNGIYVSVRKTEKNGFSFTGYQSTDRKNFTATQNTFYEIKKKAPTAGNNKPGGSTGEQTINPLDEQGTKPYQPIGNSYGEIQDYGGTPYPHPGVDLFGNYHDSVRSVKKGYIKAILTTSGFAHWRVAISNNNGSAMSIGYLYAHIDQATIPYMVGDSVVTGHVIGLLVNFPVTGFIHCHFARIMDQGSTWAGSWWTLHNPLTFISSFADSTSPVFQKTINNDVFAFRTPQGTYLSKDSLFGPVEVISKIYDHANSPWQVDVHKIRYSVSPLATPLIRLVDTLAFKYDFFIDTYFDTTYSNLLINTIYSRDNTCFSIGDYNSRDFYHIVSHTNGNDTIESADGTINFPTTSLQNGSYIFRVEAWDAKSNYAKDSIIFKVRNFITGLNSHNQTAFRVYPNPSPTGKYKLLSEENFGRNYTVSDALGKELISGIINKDSEIDLSGQENGIYFLRIDGINSVTQLKIVRMQ